MAHTNEWEARDVVFVLGSLVLSAVLVWMAALAIGPFAGSGALWLLVALAVVAVILFYASLGTLAVGGYIELRHFDWNRLKRRDDAIVWGVFALQLGVGGYCSFWLFSKTSSWVPWGHLGLALVCAIAAGVLSWRKLWPQTTRNRDGEPDADARWGMFGLVSAFLGIAAGVVVAVGVIVIATVIRYDQNPTIPPDKVVAISDITGSYVAIGDSYSAGEGLSPYQNGTAGGCDRSVHLAYADLLHPASGRFSTRFTACSGAIISDIFAQRPGSSVAPQLDGLVHPGVGLVTLTIGGNNMLFSKIVVTCFEDSDCLTSTFPPSGSPNPEPGVTPGPLESHWAPAAMLAVGKQDAVLFHALRSDFPNARIVVIGYPYLFPDTQAGWSPDDCASILRRYDYQVRLQIRGLEDKFNNLIYEEAAAAHVEFVSTRAIWRGHEPCGSRGQYTNAIKPFLSFGDPIDNGNLPNPVDRGSFHPNAAGQQTIAALVACYLNDYPSPPNPRASGGSAPIVIPSALVPPASIGLVSAPGFASSLRGCP